ncbi:MAG: hypothetical protein Q9O74_10405 [Planctomycetota bacterium]|nr:hypothetical protein [Planctomycetota bacterium]
MLAAVVGVGVGLAAAVAGLPGCTSVIYDSNPEGIPIPLDEKPDFASRTVLNLLAESISWASERHPPPDDENDGWFAINLPQGVTREQYIDVAIRIGDRATPITPEAESLPTYHIGWVWMRGDRARVDVFRPVYAISRSSGQVVHQAITLHLKRRFSSWRVEQTQPWDPGVVEVPPIYYMPLPEVVEGETELDHQLETELDDQSQPEVMDIDPGTEPAPQVPLDDTD